VAILGPGSMRKVAVILGALALAPAAHAGGPSMLVGVTADVAKQPDPALATTEVQRARLAGFDTIRLTFNWLPGQTEPPGGDLTALKNAVFAASTNGMTVIVALSHPGSRTTPLTEEQRSDFARFAAAFARAVPYVRLFTIGNEPNLNRFWLPQFGPNGENVAAPAYLQLLVAAYDALKAVSSRIVVIGGAVSPRGSDNHNLSRHTHSPTKFILDMGAAYRASGRDKPIMDAFSIHPFADNSSVSPAVAHPNTTSIGVADYAKLVSLLGRAFDGTAQRGSTLPIYYSEFGVESVPPAAKTALYTGAEPDTTKPVDEAKQGEYYRLAVQLSFCQPNVRGIILFLSKDDSSRPGWQSGVYYADGTAKTSLPAVKQAARRSHGGVVARCAGMKLTPRVTGLRFFRRNTTPPRFSASFRCDVDCRYVMRLERLHARTVAASLTNTALAGQATVRMPPSKVPAGTYQLTITFQHPVNTGGIVRRVSQPFILR
jgi:Cellulase (glycosyl hydrolase family 5)